MVVSNKTWNGSASSSPPTRQVRSIRSGNGLPPLPPSRGLVRSSQRSTSSSSSTIHNHSRVITQATLHKVFFIMMVGVFVLYVTLMVVLVRHQGTTTMETSGQHWGPHASHHTQQQLLRNHQHERWKKEQQETIQQEQEAAARVAASLLANKQGQEQAMDPAQVDLENFDVEGMFDAKLQNHQQIHTAGKSEGDSDHRETLTKNQQSTIARGTSRILKAYAEPIDMKEWNQKPLPVRRTTAADLKVTDYPRVHSCSSLIEDWPVDDFPDEDPFLPWIHDVFPTDDGRSIQFVAQDKQRCHTGWTPEEEAILTHMQPQAALFQHVPVKRLSTTASDNAHETRYRLSTHEEADEDGVATRFICRFSNGEETLSAFNVQYEYGLTRKHKKKMVSVDGRNKHISKTSQLHFYCPVPESMVDIVREGTSVLEDQATLFVSLIPIRTPPRYGRPDRFLPPYYRDGRQLNFTVATEWGNNHVLPRVEDSGRWENIPICLPTWKAYPAATSRPPSLVSLGSPENILESSVGTKKHRLVAATWASASDGEQFGISDSARRLDEWIRFHQMVGVDHFFIYDNSRSGSSLKEITDQFPASEVTRIPWPATVCNNNNNAHDSPGEWSSRYAAESSWHLRFGPHTDWMTSTSVDKYIVPVGEYESLKPFLEELDSKGTKIISFGSWMVWPRRDMIESPVPITDKTTCDHDQPCFELRLPQNRSVLQTYNCDHWPDKIPPGQTEEIYRPDYVLQPFFGSPTSTKLDQLNDVDAKKAGFSLEDVSVSPDQLSRFADEQNEVTTIYMKAVAFQDTAAWQRRCAAGRCIIGVPWPNNTESETTQQDSDGRSFNCFVNQRIEKYWVPKLEILLGSSMFRR